MLKNYQKSLTGKIEIHVLLFGDGAGAAVVGEVSEGRGILSFELGADGTGGKHLYQDEKTSYHEWS